MQNAEKGSDGERGQNLVEFALVLPVLLVLMIGGYNLGLLWLRISAADYVAQTAAVAAARYGGYTSGLQHSVDTEARNSFLGGDLANFSWRLETASIGGSVSCDGRPGPVDGEGASGSLPSPIGCTCNWGEQVTVVTSYHWKLDAVVYKWENTYQSVKSALCWRGTTGGQ